MRAGLFIAVLEASQGVAKPVAAFTYAHDAAGSRQITFTDQSTNTPTSWDWDFGDGNTSTAQNPTHTYAADGDYTVTLVATNAGGNSAPVGRSISVVGYLLLDTFSGGSVAAGTRNADIGSWTITDGNGVLSLSAGKLAAATGGVGANNPGIVKSGLSRVNGLATILRAFSVSVARAITAMTDMNLETGRNNGTISDGSSTEIILGVFVGTNDDIAWVVHATGIDLFQRNGAGNWRLVWKGKLGTTSPMSLTIGNINTTVLWSVSETAIRTQLPAPFNTDEGIAVLNVTSFTQSLGSELIANGDFSSSAGWSTTGSGWSIAAGKATKTAGVAGILYRAVASAVGDYIEHTITIANRTAGSLVHRVGNASSAGRVNNGTFTTILRRPDGNTNDGVTADASFAGDVDDISEKIITLNAVHTAVADGIFDLSVTLPGSPVAGQETRLKYRVNSVTPDSDFWLARIIRNDANTGYDIRLDSVASGSATNRILVSGVALSGTVTIRVVCDGTSHNLYTLASGAWLKRGSAVILTHENTSTGLQAVYSSAVTPVSLKAYPRTAAAYAELDRVRSTP